MGAWPAGALLCFSLLPPAAPSPASPSAETGGRCWINPRAQPRHAAALGWGGMREMQICICFPSASLFFNFQVCLCTKEGFTLVGRTWGDTRCFVAFGSPRSLPFLHCSSSGSEEDVWILGQWLHFQESEAITGMLLFVKLFKSLLGKDNILF